MVQGQLWLLPARQRQRTVQRGKQDGAYEIEAGRKPARKPGWATVGDVMLYRRVVVL